MAFLVEDGTGLVATANAYISVAEFKAYFSDRDPIDPTILNSNIEKAIVKATDFIDLKYGRRFAGSPLEQDQPLLWPRDFDVDNPLPVALKNATAEYANFALALIRLPSLPES